MYSLLGMPQKPIDKLTFEDFLMVKERLVAQEVPLQELNNRAAGKVPIKKRMRLKDRLTYRPERDSRERNKQKRYRKKRDRQETD
jgi:hypothetical protein